MARVCPTCHRPIGNGEVRFCFACRLPILRNHKWHVIGCYITHDDCQNPTMRLLVSVPENEVLYGQSEGVDHAAPDTHGTLHDAPLDGNDDHSHDDIRIVEADAPDGEHGKDA